MALVRATVTMPAWGLARGRHLPFNRRPFGGIHKQNEINDVDFSGKVAIITGGASGIGRETAEALAKRGGKVAIADINAAGAEQVTAAIVAAGGDALAVPLDVADDGSWRAAVDAVTTRFGRLDILVNGAGVELMKSIADTSVEEFRWLMTINVDGVFLGIKYALPAMRDSGGGAIINISSVAGINGYARQSAYCASKGGVRLLTKAAAIEAATGGYNVRINSVHPGVIDTPMARKFLEDKTPEQAEMTWQTLTNMHPIGRMGAASDIANAILFLASDLSSFMTGAELVVDGGITAN